MDANEEAVRSYSFTLRSLQQYATDNKPDDVDSFLALLDLFARNALGGEVFKHQRDIEEQKTVSGDD